MAFGLGALRLIMENQTGLNVEQETKLRSKNWIVVHAPSEGAVEVVHGGIYERRNVQEVEFGIFWFTV